MDDFLIEAVNCMADYVNNYLDTANMELDFSPQNGMPPVISWCGWPLPMETLSGKQPSAIVAGPSNYQMSPSLSREAM